MQTRSPLNRMVNIISGMGPIWCDYPWAANQRAIPHLSHKAEDVVLHLKAVSTIVLQSLFSCTCGALIFGKAASLVIMA